MKILIVTTNCHTLAPDHPTGVWLEEYALPYTELDEIGAHIVVASPKGGVTPIDPKTEPDDQQKKDWAQALEALNDTTPLSEVNAADFDALFIPGGHGPMKDLVDDANLQQLIADFDSSDKVIAAVCHGPAALLKVRTKEGELLIKGRKVSGFTNIEERLVMLHDVVPFLLEDALKDGGGDFESALLPMTSHVVRDGNLITGQNPASTKKITKELLEALSAMPATT